MTTFAIVTGVATLISLLLQLSGIFPKYKNYLVHATSFLCGLTVGMIVSLGSSLNISLPPTTSARNLVGIILFGGSGTLAAVLMLASVVLPDPQRRKVATQTASAVSGFLIFLLVFFISTFFPEK